MFAKRGYVLLLFFLTLPGLAAAQLRNQNVNMSQALKPSKVNDIVGLLGLNPDKFSMSHSYSLSFASSGGESYNSALYLNTMQYRLSDPLTLYMQIGIQHYPFGNKFGDTNLQNQIFVSGAGLQYKPSDNMKLYLEFSQTPASTYYHNAPFRDPISRNRAWFDKEDKEAAGDSR